MVKGDQLTLFSSVPLTKGQGSTCFPKGLLICKGRMLWLGTLWMKDPTAKTIKQLTSLRLHKNKTKLSCKQHLEIFIFFFIFKTVLKLVKTLSNWLKKITIMAWFSIEWLKVLWTKLDAPKGMEQAASQYGEECLKINCDHRNIDLTDLMCWRWLIEVQIQMVPSSLSQSLLAPGWITNILFLDEW